MLEVEWVKVDLSAPRDELPNPLNYQSGGRFWVVSDGGIHGRSVIPAWWTGERFADLNNDIITYFAPMEVPELPGIYSDCPEVIHGTKAQLDGLSVRGGE